MGGSTGQFDPTTSTLMNPWIDSDLNAAKDHYRGVPQAYGARGVTSQILREKHKRRPRLHDLKKDALEGAGLYDRKRVLEKSGMEAGRSRITIASLFRSTSGHGGSSFGGGCSYFKEPRRSSPRPKTPPWANDDKLYQPPPSRQKTADPREAGRLQTALHAKSLPHTRYGQVECYPAPITKEMKESRFQALRYDRPCGNHLIRQAPASTSLIRSPDGSEDMRDDPVAALKRLRATAPKWVGPGPVDPRGKGSVQNLMEIFPPSLSSTTRPRCQHPSFGCLLVPKPKPKPNHRKLKLKLSD